MPRRRLGPGEWGEVSVSRPPGGSLYRARAWFRDFDGVRRMVERDARTEWAARTALETALAERARRGAGSLRGSDTFAAAATVWSSGWSGWRGWGSGRREQWRHTRGS